MPDDLALDDDRALDAALPPADRRRIARLIQRTATTARFQMCIIEIASPREGHAVEAWVRGEMPGEAPVRRFDIGALPGQNLWAELGEAVGDGPRPRGWVLVGLEEHPPDERRRRVTQLNVQRDSLTRDFSGLWFVLIHPSLRPLLMQAAPDFVDYAVIWTRRAASADAVARPEINRAPASTHGGNYDRPRLAAAYQPVVAAIDAADLDRAEDLLGALQLGEGPEDVASREWLKAELRIRRGRYDLALAAWGPAGAAFLGVPEGLRPGILRCLADLLVGAGQLDAAVSLLRERALPLCRAGGDAFETAQVWGVLGDVAMIRGGWDEALRIRREEQLPVYDALGDVRARAVTMGKIAYILLRRGALDEALRIHREEQLPVYDALGDVRARAITLGQIANILQSRGALDEALRILREEVRPAFDALGDVRARAVTMGKIADILYRRGALDEALRIRREEELPVYDALGDVRARAITLGEIADILERRGALDEALRIRREEQLPVYDALGDVRGRAVTMGQIADILQRRGALDEALRIRREEQLPVYDALGDVRERAITLGQIAGILQRRGALDEALRIRREEALPVYDALGDTHGLMVSRANIALALSERGRDGDQAEIERLLCDALAIARSRGYAEAAPIAGIMSQLGMPAELIAGIGQDAPSE